MKMKLSVPLVRQPKKTPDCGVACVAMLLEFYGVKYDYKKLRQEIGAYTWGTSAPQLGLWFLKHGFDVEIVTMHPALFNIFSRFETKEKMLKHLMSFNRKLKGRLNNIVLKHFIDFVHAGGKILPQIPSVHDIQKEVSAKRPIISMLTHWFLFDSKLQPRFTQHFNVISGLDKKFVYVNDPDWGDEFGGRHKHKIETYLYAVYASAFGSIDNASFLKIKKR